VAAEDWCYASGVAAVIETFVLDPAAVAELRAAGVGVSDILPRARRSPVYAELDAVDGPLRAARALEAEYVGYVRGFAAECPDERIAAPILAEYDFRDAANWLKATYAGGERRPLELSALPAENAEAWIAESPLVSAAADAVRTAAEETPDGTLPVTTIDLIVDGAFIAAIPSLTAPLGSELLDAWSLRRQAFAAAEAVLRARWAGVGPDELAEHLLPWLAGESDGDARGVPGGGARGTARSGRLSADLLELVQASDDGVRAVLARIVGAELADSYDPSAGAGAAPAFRGRLDDELTASLAPGRAKTYGPERVFAFLWSLSRENRGLRAAAVSAALGGG
jgi:hypothetical protein